MSTTALGQELDIQNPADEKSYWQVVKNKSAPFYGYALQEAQEILIRCGAISYCVDQLLRRHQAGQAILDETPLRNKAAVDSVIAAIISPVQRLFETVGVSPRALTTLAGEANLEG